MSSKASQHPSRTVTARILAAAGRHFFAHGFRLVTMDDLAHELGMSKKTLYACFASKQALLEALLRYKFRALALDLQRIAETPQDVPHALRAMLACVHRHIDEIQPPFVRDVGRAAPELFALIERQRRRILRRYFGKLFADASRAGLMRDDIDPRFVLEVLLGAMQAVMTPQKLGELGLAPQSGFSDIITIVLEGVLRRPPSPHDS